MSKLIKEHLIEDIKKGKRDNISMSVDSDDDYSVIAERFPVMLYTPEKGEHDHSHIRFTDDEIYKLGLWIDKYLKMKRRVDKMEKDNETL